MCRIALNILEMTFTCMALEIYDDKNFDLSHTFHRVKKINMKDVHRL
jgi:hypothetical protein